jgi:hypothetical protein
VRGKVQNCGDVIREWYLPSGNDDNDVDFRLFGKMTQAVRTDFRMSPWIFTFSKLNDAIAFSAKR